MFYPTQTEKTSGNYHQLMIDTCKKYNMMPRSRTSSTACACTRLQAMGTMLCATIMVVAITGALLIREAATVVAVSADGS